MRDEMLWIALMFASVRLAINLFKYGHRARVLIAFFSRHPPLLARTTYGRPEEAGSSRTPSAPGTPAEAATARPREAAASAAPPPGRVLLKPWWESRPKRLADELRRLDEAGISYRIDTNEQARGRLRLEVEVPIGHQVHRLQALFPDVYPYTRFEVIAPDLDLPRHQNPFQKNLCLIGRPTSNWNVHDTLADFLLQRFPKVVAVARSEDPEYRRREEEPQGEPYSDHYAYGAESSILIDSSWKLDPAVRHGKLELGFEKSNHPIRGAVLEIRDAKDHVLARAPAALRDRYTLIERGRWIRFDEPIRQPDAESFLNVLAKEEPKFREKRMTIKKQPLPDVIGVVFPEEVQQGVMSDGWVFLGRANNGIALVRAARAGLEDVYVRAPEMAPLHHKRVAVVGLGSLGAVSALELARSGVGRLVLADFDHVEAGTISRWPLGFEAIGRAKVNALQEFLRKNYPYTDINSSPGMIGGSLDRDYSDLESLQKLLDCDLILDATAEVGIQHLLSDLAIEHRKPYVCVSTTAGAWGGLVARILPGATKGCWVCLQHAIANHQIPAPVAKPNGFVQPIGCASPTFTGAGFDTATIAESAVRMVVMTLCEDKAGWDVEVIDMRNPTGDRIPLRTRAFPLQRQRDCKSAIAHHD